MITISESYIKLKSYCESQNFAGWDPYDGLNSKIFQATPLKNCSFARLTWIQIFKRSSINFRNLLLVPKEHNAKGIGLFLIAYCNIYKYQQTTKSVEIGNQNDILNKINYLAALLISMQSKGYSGACWGYNFDWQSKAFFLPKLTPTVVATSFAVEALLNAFEITGNEDYKLSAISSASFILNDLNRIEKPHGFMFSYSPIDNRAVYNASLLGSKTLSLINKYQPSKEYSNTAFISTLAVCEMQNSNGSFPHSDQVGNDWRDNFHTGFKLESIACYQKYCGDLSFASNIEKGFNYWIEHFFDHKTGIAHYYDTGGNLIDLHCAAQAITTFFKLGKLNENSELVDKIILWSIKNMQAKNGSFYFQKKGSKTNKICYMRWPNAWMFYGMSYYFLNKAANETH